MRLQKHTCSVVDVHFTSAPNPVTIRALYVDTQVTSE